MDLEPIIEKDESFRRGLLLSTNEKRVAKARAEMLKAQAQLEMAKKEAAVARQEARELREHLITSSTSRLKIPFRTIAAATTVILLVAAVAKIAYQGYIKPPSSPTVVSATPAEKPSHRILTHKPQSAGEIEFKNAMSRLQDDLGSLPEGQSEIVREVNQHFVGRSRPCPLEWVNGEAALSLDGDERRIPPSLTTAVTECAAAVEKYRDEKELSLRSVDASN